MKICYLADINSYHTKKWCKYFLSKGHEVSVISINDGNLEGVKVYSLNINSKISKNQNSFNKFLYLNKLRNVKKIINKIKPDILHAHYASSYGLLGALANYHPYIISLWGSDILLFPRQGLLQKNIIKYNLKKADRIFSTSLYMKEESMLYTNKEIYITPFGIDTNIFSNRKVRKEENIVIGIVKSLERIYGIEYLIKAFFNLQKKYSNINLEIVGEGTEEENLKKLVEELNIQDKVSFHGKLDLYEVAEFYNRINIAVFPSISESFGVSILEAQACGLPVIVSNIKAFFETTIVGKTSLLCEIKDVESIENQLDKLINNKELRERMGVEGSRFVKENFDEIREFEKVEKLYNDILT